MLIPWSRQEKEKKYVDLVIYVVTYYGTRLYVGSKIVKDKRRDKKITGSRIVQAKVVKFI